MAFVLDAVTGTVLGELLKAVMEVKARAEMFENVLQSIESTLTSITPEFEKLKKLTEKLDCGDDKEITKFWEQIEKGKTLVMKCTEINCCCSCFKKPRYTKELQKLDDSLKRFCQIVMPVIQARLQMQTLVEVVGIHDEVEEIHDKVEDLNVQVQDIHEKMMETHEEVKEMHEDVKDTGVEVKDIHQEVIETHEKVKDIDEGVKETNVHVKVIQEKVENINEKLDRLTPSEKSSPISSNTASLPPCMPPDPPEHIVGLDRPLKELKKALLKDAVSVIVLSAPGGCGKTTLAKKLCRDEEVEGKFKDNVFFVTVSKTPNLKAIIQQLFLHKGYQLPEFQNDEEAVNRLEKLLKQIVPKPILLVLDDAWPESECLLDKFNFQIPDYKILVTSRSTFPRFDYTYKLETLKYEDSMSLFRHSAGLLDETSHSVDEDVVEKVVHACKGFPLALTVVGRSLHGQPEVIWQETVNKWSKGISILESNINLLNCLKSSLDVLDDKLKECYMDLSVFPEGQLIPATALIDMWEELYELNKNGLNSIANLHKLSSLNLVNLVVTRKDSSEVEGYYNDHFVMQHDLLGEMVNHLSRLDGVEEERKRLVVEIKGDEFPKWWRELKHQPIRARLLSISTDETFSSKWCNMQAPEVEVLILNLRTKNYILPKFMMNMDKLKALIVTNYGFFPSEIKNFSFLCYLSNLKRIRLEQVLIPFLDLSSVQLKNLEKVSLLRCNLGQAFGNSDIQISDAFPNLEEINIGYCTHLVELPIGLSDIVHLRKLYITYCHELSRLPEGIGKLVNLEVLRLSSCIKLSGLPGTIGMLNKLSILDISDCISIMKLPEQIGELQNLRKLYMTGCLNCELPKSIAKLMHLKYVICDEETAKSWAPLKRYLSNLSIKC